MMSKEFSEWLTLLCEVKQKPGGYRYRDVFIFSYLIFFLVFFFSVGVAKAQKADRQCIVKQAITKFTKNDYRHIPR